jgi:hypothetical protein
MNLDLPTARHRHSRAHTQIPNTRPPRPITSWVAITSVLAAMCWVVGQLPEDRTVRQIGASLECRIHHPPGVGSRVLLINRSTSVLPAGTEWIWAGADTPLALRCQARLV